jgi:hypothetical protein
MKIAIGINGFKSYSDLEKREKFCIDSLLKIKNTNKNINLYNVCFNDESTTYDEFITLNKLHIHSNELIHEYFQHDGLTNEYNARKKEIDDNSKKLPSVKEIFDVLAGTDCDYFLFLNNDIIISNRFLKEIEESIECYPISRMHIYDIESLNDTPKLESYSVHGFDAFLVKKETWLNIRNHFEDIILGRFYWDTYFATMFNILCKCKNINKLPPVCFHIEHGSTSNQDHIENYYNEDVFKRNLLIGHLWFSYVQNVLLKRNTVNGCKWYQPFENETVLERQHFNIFDVKQYNVKFTPKPVEKKTDYDLFIPVAPKDELKLKYVIEYANKNLNAKNIFVCSPHNIKDKISEINYINDLDVINIQNKDFIGFRPNWTYQQFLKMFFKQSYSEYYFALDCDTIILKRLPLFEDNHPIWYYGWKQNHFPYFLFNRRVFNLKKSLTHTGIGDLGLFNKTIVDSFLQSTGCSTPEELLKNIGGYTNTVFHFSEYETYANFCDQYYPGLYTFKHLEQLNEGRDLNQGNDWNSNDIELITSKALKTDKSILSIHSWKI